MSPNSQLKVRPASSHRRVKNRIEARLLTKAQRKLIASRIFQSTDPAQGTVLKQYAQHSKSESMILDVSVRVAYSAPLKYSDHSHMSASSTSTLSEPSVSFQEIVSIIEIPSHRSYDSEARKNIWNSKHHIRANAARNKIEFAADGRDWRKCKEEDEMLTLNGELVHPVTYLSLQRYHQRRIFQRLREENLKDSSSTASTEKSSKDSDHSTSRVTKDVTSDSAPRENLFFLGPPEAIRSTAAGGNSLDISTSFRLLPSHLLPPQSRRLLLSRTGQRQLLKPKLLRKKDLKVLPVRSQIGRKCVAPKRSSLLQPAKRAVLLN